MFQEREAVAKLQLAISVVFGTCSADLTNRGLDWSHEKQARVEDVLVLRVQGMET